MHTSTFSLQHPPRRGGPASLRCNTLLGGGLRPVRCCVGPTYPVYTYIYTHTDVHIIHIHTQIHTRIHICQHKYIHVYTFVKTCSFELTRMYVYSMQCKQNAHELISWRYNRLVRILRPLCASLKSLSHHSNIPCARIGTTTTTGTSTRTAFITATHAVEACLLLVWDSLLLATRVSFATSNDTRVRVHHINDMTLLQSCACDANTVHAYLQWHYDTTSSLMPPGFGV